MRRHRSTRYARYAFGLTLMFSALTGFAQMPIFKRYYIADFPGLGWLDRFYLTYELHAVSAALLLMLSAYLVGEYLLLLRRRRRVSPAGYIRGAMLAGIMVSGLALIYKNLPGYRLSPEVVVALDFSHLSAAILFLFATAAAGMLKKGWLADRGTLKGR